MLFLAADMAHRWLLSARYGLSGRLTRLDDSALALTLPAARGHRYAPGQEVRARLRLLERNMMKGRRTRTRGRSTAVTRSPHRFAAAPWATYSWSRVRRSTFAWRPCHGPPPRCPRGTPSRWPPAMNPPSRSSSRWCVAECAVVASAVVCTTVATDNLRAHSLRPATQYNNT
jgi:hypothetical protein